jgi:hypothetical protein
VLRNWPSWTTAKVQHPGPFAESVDETVVPEFVVPVGVLTVAVPRGRVFFVMPDNPISEISKKSGNYSRIILAG